jgi:hypothetical protein
MQWNWPASWLPALLALLIWPCAQPSRAQTSALDAAVAAEIRDLAGHAGAIFVGQIVSITRSKSVVQITFRVDQGLTGARGRTYVLREWAGLWPQGQLRYTVGQRALAFLHAPSAAGFSTPVHGAEGLIPVTVQGPTAPLLLDIRRVAASVPRTPGTPLPTEQGAGVPLADALALIQPHANAAPLVLTHRLLPTRGEVPGAPRLGSSPLPVSRPVHEIPTAPAETEAGHGAR